VFDVKNNGGATPRRVVAIYARSERGEVLAFFGGRLDLQALDGIGKALSPK
jgi:hypothetical protein